MNKDYKTEGEFLKRIQNVLENSGCKVWREVVPDEEKNKSLPLKVDMIFYRDDFGLIGVEGKNLKSLRQGSIFAKAILQVQKYRALTYFNGSKIDRWCITTPQKSAVNLEDTQKIITTEITYFIRTFVKYMYDLSFLELHEYSNPLWDKISIDYLTKNSIHISKNEAGGNDTNTKTTA